MRRVSLMLVLVVLICLAFSRTAFAAKGEVVLKKSGCDYFIVESNMGFAILEWYGEMIQVRAIFLLGIMNRMA